MCGIFGVVPVESGVVPDAEKLDASAGLLRHRGPDNQEIHTEAGLGLAHCRLSLLDLRPRSDQPFWDPSGRYVLVYNGEIYNHPDLRRRLRDMGVEFRTTSDTEVLLMALIHLGVERTLSKLEGMFAFGFYDTESGDLYLARDRFGTKPLFVYEDDRRLIFSSELEAFRPWLGMEADPWSISSFLHGFLGPTEGRTFYRGISFVGAGELLHRTAGGETNRTRFFTIDEFRDPDLAGRLAAAGRHALVDELDDLLFEAVHDQLIADARVGALCSGGVDSSLLLAMAARQHSDLAIFHADLVGRYSERGPAARLADHLGLQLNVVEVSPTDVIDALPEVTYRYGLPVMRPESVPLYYVSQLVRDEGVKAVLTGEGADECFLGYSWIPPRLLSPDYYVSLLRDWKRRVFSSEEGLPTNTLFNPPNNEGFFRALLNRFEESRENQRIVSALESSMDRTPRRSDLLTLRLLGYHLRTELLTSDNMGMAASVEGRYPFLDHDVVRFAVNLPYGHKVSFDPTQLHSTHPGFAVKWIVRAVADRYLPQALGGRAKQPFRVEAMRQLSFGLSFFRNSYLVDFLELSEDDTEHLAATASRHMKQRLFLLELWLHVCLYQDSRSSLRERLRRDTSIGEAQAQRQQEAALA